MTHYKKCISCGEEKPKNNDYFFYRNKEKGWLSSWCKECHKEKRKLTKQKDLASQRARRGIKPCKICQSKNKVKGKSYCSGCLNNKIREQKRVDKCLYKSRLRKAKPAWADADKIREFYKNRPEGMHVDHIIPIRGELVCGLHVEYNLQYLDALENILKSNKLDHYSLEHNGIK